MPLTGPQHQQLQQALLSAFDEAGLRQLARQELDANLDSVTPSGDLTQRTYELVDWAKRGDRIIDLIRGALSQNSGNKELRGLAAAAMQWPACVDAGEALFIAGKPAPRRVEEAYLTDLITTYNVWAEKYTPLAGIAEVQAEETEPTLGLSPLFMPSGFEKLVEHGYGPEKRIEREPVDDLREAVTKHRRLVVLGEPGSGKTTTLWRLVYDYAEAAQQDPTAPIPILAPLGGYTGPEPALAHLAQFAGELGLHLPAYLESGQAVLLLDALNEMPRDGYKERIGRIQALIDRFPETPVVVTCRALDYEEALKLEKVDVVPLDVFRQREYLHRYLGEVAGDKLFWQLAGGDGVSDLWGAWQRLGGTFEQLWTVKELPDEIRWSMTWVQRDTWETLHKDDLPPLLALGVNPYLLVMTAQVYVARKGRLPKNRGTLFAAFADTLLERERQRRKGDRWPGAEVLSTALAELAYAMQWAGERGPAVERHWAIDHLANGPCSASDALYLAASATLLDTSGEMVRFVHQLIQEYFAALAWQKRFETGDDLHRYWPDAWVKPTGWEETAVLLAGILPDMAKFVEALLPVNPPLAARCIAESGDVRPGGATIDEVQGRLVEIATSLTAPVMERNAAGNALNYLGDPRPGVGLREDGLPDIIWCKVPAGEFISGTRQKSHTVSLPAFAISKYPITNVQYQAFVENGGYTEKCRKCWTHHGWAWMQNRINLKYLVQ